MRGGPDKDSRRTMKLLFSSGHVGFSYFDLLSLALAAATRGSCCVRKLSEVSEEKSFPGDSEISFGQDSNGFSLETMPLLCLLSALRYYL